MDKLFDSTWMLRITALILAVLLFFFVNDDSDEKQTTSSNIQVATLTDIPLEAYYDDENLIVSGLPQTVDVTIEGPMPIVLETKITKDFKVFVDLNSLLLGSHRVTIQTEGLSDKLDVSIDPKYVNITIEEKVTKEFTVDPEINERLIAPDYVLQSIVAEPNTVKITGAKSVIESISYVKANVTAENGINESFQQKASIRVLDSSLNRLDVFVEPETVNVKVNVMPYKKEVPITIKRVGSPMQGVKVNSITPKTKLVEVFGPKAVIDELNELVVEFDISNIEKSGEHKVKLNVPNGATKLSVETITIEVNVTNESNKPSEPEQNDQQNTNVEDSD